MNEMKDREDFVKAARSYQATCERVERRARQHIERGETARVKAMIATVVDDSISDGRADENVVLNATPDREAGRTV